MYKATKPTIKTGFNVNKSYEGESIEAKMRRVTENKEPINDSSPIVYTERKDGVRPEYDIRTDRFEIAIDAMDKVAKAKIAKREERMKAKTEDVPRTEVIPRPGGVETGSQGGEGKA